MTLMEQVFGYKPITRDLIKGIQSRDFAFVQGTVPDTHLSQAPEKVAFTVAVTHPKRGVSVLRRNSQ
jgi:hypothetical protein